MSNENRSDFTPKVIAVEQTLMCGYKRCCPRVRIYEDGSATFDDEGQVIEFNPDQVKALGAMLAKIST